MRQVHWGGEIGPESEEAIELSYMTDRASDLKDTMRGIATLTRALQSIYEDDSRICAALRHIASTQEDVSKGLKNIELFLYEKWKEEMKKEAAKRLEAAKKTGSTC